VKADVTDNGNGTYRVVYNPKAQGKHLINVNVRSKPILNSPFSVVADRLGVDPSKSKAFGPGLEHPPSKEPTYFTIVANNRKGDPVGTGADRFDVKITDPYDSEVKSEVVDNRDGTYTVSYRPIDTGNHTIVVQHEGKNVADSPYHVKVHTNPLGPDASKSHAFGPGLQEIVEGEPAVFTIQAKNAAGENLTKGGDPFDVEVIGPDDTIVEGVRVVDNRDGTYGVTYQPTEPGRYKVDVILRGANPLYYDHVGNSPVVINAEVGVDPSKSLVYGPGVESNVLNTKPAEFTIEARDKDNKKLDKPGVQFEVKVTDQDQNNIGAQVTDNGDGTFKVVYDPTGDAKRLKVDVRLKGKPVGNTPVTVNVKDGASYDHTLVDSFSFVIRTKTKKNQDKKEGGEASNFEVKIVHEGSREEVKNVKVQDIGDGTYVVSYSLPNEGDYKIHVLLNGHHIKGSPWKQSH